MAELGADLGGFPQSYPIEYAIEPLKDGAALRMRDALGRTADMGLTHTDITNLVLHLAGALRNRAATGSIGRDTSGTSGHN